MVLPRANLMLLFLPLLTAAAVPPVLDDFTNLDAWTVNASDGVVATIAPAAGPDGPCLRLDFDFRAGAGFCVVRRDVQLDLPDNYRFTFAVRGDAPSNNFEFKLIDESGDNVWWVNRRDYAFPRDWETTRYKARHFRFAWGPSGGDQIQRLSAIEFAVAASSGGAGSIHLDTLTFEPLPKPQPVTATPVVRFSSNDDAAPHGRPLPPDGQVAWASAVTDNSPWIELDLGQMRELGGLILDWADEAHPRDYDVHVSFDGKTWEPGAHVRSSNGGRDYVALPEAEAQFMKVAAVGNNPAPIGLRRLQVRDVDFSESPNRFFAAIAADSARGRFPEYLLQRQVPWTVVGVAGDPREALVSAHGAVEVDRGAWSIEPFLYAADGLLTWADAQITHSLADGYVPIPTVTWRIDGLQLDATFFADGNVGASELVARYQVRNLGDAQRQGALQLAIRPLQVLPPWQDLNLTGGVAPIETIARDGAVIRVNGDKVIKLHHAPADFGAATLHQGDITEYLARDRVPLNDSAIDPDAFASAALRYPFDLDPGDVYTVVISVPFHDANQDPPRQVGGNQVAGREDEPAPVDSRMHKAIERWKRELDRVTLKLPPSARNIEDTFRATQAYILINGDGPSIQPGSRTYERSWIRDGAITSAALLATGHTEKVRAFLEWYAGHQFPDGKVPCVVDRRGPDPVPEHDSTGEFIYALLTYYRHTRDMEFLKTHLPQVIKGVDYLESLRNQRTTERYQQGSPIERACYGLVPESISHEGYSAKPMHSYWDNFFTVKGLADAAEIARVLGRSDLEERFSALHRAHHVALYRSFNLAMQHHGIDYLPGCAELGDFDATSTAIGVFPCDQLASLPQPALDRTFDRYFDFFEQRRTGALSWDGYTPYELRIVGTFVRLGQPQRAHALLDFFMQDQTPPGWRQWAEVVYRDHRTPRFIGDMPHTWVGSAFLNSIRTMFVYEDGDQLVLLAGVTPDWLADDGVALGNFPTIYGRLDLRARMTGATLNVEIEGDAQPPGGSRLILPFAARPSRVLLDDAAVEPPPDRALHLPAGTRRVEVTWQ